MTLGSEAARLNGYDLKILATDLDTNVLQTAYNAEYSLDQTRGISADYRAKYLTEIAQNHFQINKSLRDWVAFRKLNFFEDWPMKGNFDLILCRNALIYFDLATQKQLIGRFSRLQKSGDYLIVGHSESLEQVTRDYELVCKTVYKKR
jgi:chemotaxis protein methyltransferase CheR